MELIQADFIKASATEDGVENSKQSTDGKLKCKDLLYELRIQQ